MKIFIDTNVILDALLKRQPFYEDAVKLFALCEQKIIKGYISSASVTDIHYIAKKSFKDGDKTIDAIKNLLAIFKTANVKHKTLVKAVNSGWKDFEDAVQFYAAKEKHCSCIITGNKKDFELSDIPIFEITDFLSR